MRLCAWRLTSICPLVYFKEKNMAETNKSLDEIVTALRKQFGERILMTLSDEPLRVPVISTGSLNLNHALGIGGIPRGRITELFGPAGGGKTSIAQHCVAEAQKGGGEAVYIDMEHKVDPNYMAACGIDLTRLHLSQPQSGTTALDLVRKLVASNTIDLIVVDSVAALCTSAELDAAAGDHFVGVQARMMSQNLKAIVPVLGLSKTVLLFINQTRMKIGVSWGSPETTSGGVALRFYASIRMRVSRKGNLGAKGKEYGIRSVVRVRKNCLAPPWKEAEFDIIWGKGIDPAGDLLDYGAMTGVIAKSDSHWYSYGEQKFGRGRPKARLFLVENPEIAKEIRDTANRTEEGILDET